MNVDTKIGMQMCKKLELELPRKEGYRKENGTVRKKVGRKMGVGLQEGCAPRLPAARSDGISSCPGGSLHE